MFKHIFVLLLLFAPHIFQAQNFTLSGYIKDKDTGEDLVGASIFVKDQPAKGAATNNYGFYSLTLAKGTYTMVVSYVGYTGLEIKVNLNQDVRQNFDLGYGVDFKEEVVITAEKADKNVNNTQMGTTELKVDEIEKLPALMGEVDIMKTIDLLPGVMSAGEGSSGFYVRGGGPDQNLVLLDESIVYNTGHLFGFFSVFNSDAIKNMTLIKGNMPAQYGGRLSSVVDVQMKEGNNKKYAVEGGIGAIASRLTVEGPIVKDKASFIFSGRRTYAVDIAQPFLKGTDFEGTNYYFYDVNAKMNYTFSEKDRLYFSSYFGRDVFKFSANDRDIYFEAPWGNATATIRWNHLYNDKLFSNVTAVFNDYKFKFLGKQDNFSFQSNSGIRDYGLKANWDWIPSPRHYLKFGGEYLFHQFTPTIGSLTSNDQEFGFSQQKKYANETAVYANDDIRFNEKFSLSAGLRLVMYQQIGPYTSDSTGRTYKTFQPVKTYWGAEPRVSAKYSLNGNSSLKAGFALANQFVHLVSLSASTLPTDLWVPSTERVKPQVGLQYSVGYFRNFKDNMFETSVELYYKDLYNQLDYAEYYVPQIDDDPEKNFITGKGQSYGAEFFIKKRTGKLTGWIGYTLARAQRDFAGVAGGRYAARFDRTHDLSVVANYDFSKKFNIGAVFVYSTGNAYTPLKSLYLINFTPVVEYGKRNSARLDDYHRLDLSFNWNPSAGKNKRFESSWSFSVYNVYSRKNVFFTFTDPITDALTGTLQNKAYKVSLFPVIPSVTWNFKWK